jgi:hypothetical protein
MGDVWGILPERAMTRGEFRTLVEIHRRTIVRVTIKDSPKGLCGTCKFAVLVRGMNNESYLKCDQIYFGNNTNKPDRVPFIVKECTSFRKVGTMDLVTMGAVAWILEVDKRKGSAGFISSEDWNAKHPKDDVIPRHRYGDYD